ncbi:MAG: glycosyltransferase family 2 protein [Ilumatobacteraceae bacterium]|nr:glycosyltransferase family 2 protein [Ilumatobacteraceae bacterium]
MGGLPRTRRQGNSGQYGFTVALPTISVVIPCYNYARFLTAAVVSVVHQPGVEVEVIIVDDCSTDETPEVAAALAADFPSVRVASHSSNQGLIRTINDGITEAQGDLLLVLSADDCVAPGTLSRAAQAFESYPQVGMVFGQREEFTDPSTLPNEDRYLALAGPGPAGDIHVHRGVDWVTERCRQGINLIASPEVLVRMSVQRAIGGYDPECRHTSDLNMWLRAAMASDVAYVAGPPFAYYRKHDQNMSVVEFGDASVNLSERWKAFDRAIEGSQAADATRERWRRLSRRSLMTEARHEIRRAQERDADASVVVGLRSAAREIGGAASRIGARTTEAGRARADHLGRIRHRLRWRRWLARWKSVGL